MDNIDRSHRLEASKSYGKSKPIVAEFLKINL